MNKRSRCQRFFTIILLICNILAVSYLVFLAAPSYGQLLNKPNYQQQQTSNQQSTISGTIDRSTLNQSKNAYNSSERPHTVTNTMILKKNSPDNDNIFRIKNIGNDASINGSNNIVAMITFGDGWKNQFTTAKPILDKYGFKASFYIPCKFPGLSDLQMTWQDIAALQRDGMDIESKGMNDVILTNASASKLAFEIGQSKQCLTIHGINNATVFATPHGKGSDNSTVVNTIAKYYDLAINGFSNLMFLHCDGWKQYSPNQTDCRTFDSNGKLTYANRYVIREWSHNTQDVANLHNDSKIFQQFVKEINKQIPYNKNGTKTTIDAIPILAYHRIDNERTHVSTDIGLFGKEMKYLHDNGFRVITISDLGYDERSNYFYLRN
jgi:peptidoglycan/xylan/chitin deacetylase (PgdA/CDA1 family)